MYTYVMAGILLFPWSILIATCVGWYVQRRRTAVRVRAEAPATFRKTA
jgi:hypothetical protein